MVSVGQIVGALTLKFTVDAFEDAWRGGSSEIIVSELNDIVFMASREDWHFRTLAALSPVVLAQVADTQQYPLDRLVVLENSRRPLAGQLSLISMQEGGAREDFISASTMLEDVGWRVWLLVPAGPARAQAWTAMLVFVLAVLFVGLALMSVLQRRARILERLEAQRAAQDML